MIWVPTQKEEPMQTIFIALALALGFAVLKKLRAHPRRAGSGRILDRAIARFDAGPLAEKLGWRPTYGYLQLAVIDAALEYRTVSVTGDAWIPSHYTAELSSEDFELIAHLHSRFALEIASVLGHTAEKRGWRIDTDCVVFVSVDAAAPSLRPRVTPVRDIAPAPHSAFGDDHQVRNACRANRIPLLSPTSEMPAKPLPKTNQSPGLHLNPVSPDLGPVRLGSADDAFVIGRSPHLNATVDSPSVSWMHARITRTGKGWMITDLGSSNGTIVNGRKIAAPQAIETGDIVSLGQNVIFQVGDGHLTHASNVGLNERWSPSFS